MVNEAGRYFDTSVHAASASFKQAVVDAKKTLTGNFSAISLMVTGMIVLDRYELNKMRPTTFLCILLETPNLIHQ
jgi:hypothetical protein